MHNTQRQQQLTNDAPAAIYRERSILDAVLEKGVREPAAPAAPSALDGIAAEPVGKWSRGRKLVVRDVQVARQDADTQCVGGLFGMVEESAEPARRVHGSQMSLPMGAVQTDRGSGICICGDKGCDIGPFVRTGGGR